MLTLHRYRTLGRAVILALAAAASIVPIAAVAHPLGNFTTNHLTRISVNSGTVQLHYVLDLAEIPTVSLEHTLAASGQPSHAQLQAWADDHAVTIAPQLKLSVDGARIDLGHATTSVRLRPGAVGLHLLYFTADYRAALPPHARQLQYEDDTALGRIGWKDVVLSPGHEPTHELLTYPSALVGSPRARTTLTATIDARGVAHQTADSSDAAFAPAPSVGRMDALSSVLAQHGAGPLFLLGAILLAIGLGSLHALEPGHGKTLLAVSLVGARATTRQALILAVALTIAHTIGVLILGAVVLFATRWIVPEAVYPWITLLSGGLVAFLGARALAREIRRRRPVAHQHPHAHPSAHEHAHDHAHGLGTIEHHHHDEVVVHDHASLDDEAHALAHAIPGSAPLTFRTAVFAAASGNIAPCPAALVVLLAAISLHRIGFGMTLIVAFSVGLAVTLTTLGIAVVRGAAWLSGRPQFARLSQWAPLASAGAIALVGSFMLAQGLVAQGVGVPLPIVAGLSIAAILGYAFTLPHRHISTGSAHA